MTQWSKPRAGSLAFYPRKRAKREMPSYKTFLPQKEREARALNFLGYKAGMTHVLGKNIHDKSTTFGQDIFVPCTIIECPPIKVFGVRAYSKENGTVHAIAEAHAQKIEKELLKKINRFKKKSKKEKEETSKEKTIKDLEGMPEITEFRLLAHSQPKLSGIGKKRPEVLEIRLSGTKEKQLEYAREKLGKELNVKECFSEQEFVDVKAVTKGHGTTGVIKRFGVKTLKSPKSKTERVVGSIGPWNPSTVMWTVARAGQHGYHTRTEYSRRILMIGENGAEITPGSGFKQYGVVRNSFLLLSGSVPGPAKRAIALRTSLRKIPENKFKLASIDFIASKGKKQAHATEYEVKAQKVETVEEKKAEKKSVEQEIAEAVEGGKK